MQKDFHYYATYCAAILAGYSHEESQSICYCAQLPDWCSKTFLETLGAPTEAATTQLKLEMMKVDTGPIGLQDITRIWSSFHFLPYDLYAEVGKGGRRYREKYRLICGPNGSLVKDTVELAKGESLQAAGLAMHVLADTWAHSYFAGTPSLVINNTNSHFFEILDVNGKEVERQIAFIHNPSAPDDLEAGAFSNTVYNPSEDTIMNLGHGRAGHFPDYSFAKYRYLPAWNDYHEITKDNPKDYYQAFCQMVYALRCLRGDYETFETERYETDVVEPWRERIHAILTVRCLENCEGWQALGEELSGHDIEDFDLHAYQQEYLDAEGDARDDTFLGGFILAALAQKSMVTNKIFRSNSLLAGESIDYHKSGFAGLGDYVRLIRHRLGGRTS